MPNPSYDIEQLKALLERLEKAEGADRNLDSSIYNWLVGNHSNEPFGMFKFAGCPYYTSSIDASLGLVGEVSPANHWELYGGGDIFQFNLGHRVPKSWTHCLQRQAGIRKTAPLAILSALLKTLIAQHETEEVE
jgi:hypothetical protein